MGKISNMDLYKMLQGLLSNVQNVQRNLHPVNKNTMGVALKIVLATGKKDLFIILFIYSCSFCRKKMVLRELSLHRKNKQGKLKSAS